MTLPFVFCCPWSHRCRRSLKALERQWATWREGSVASKDQAEIFDFLPFLFLLKTELGYLGRGFCVLLTELRVEEALGTTFAISQGNLLQACRDHAWVVFSSPSPEVHCAKRVAPERGTSWWLNQGVPGWQLCGFGASASSPRFKFQWTLWSTWNWWDNQV